jgi:hypothetical protein
VTSGGAQCVETMATTGAWTLDLADAPLATWIQNVTYPAKNGVERVVIRGSGATRARDGSALATPDSVTSLCVLGSATDFSRTRTDFCFSLSLSSASCQVSSYRRAGIGICCSRLARGGT